MGPKRSTRAALAGAGLCGVAVLAAALSGGCNRPYSGLGEGNAASPGLDKKVFAMSCDDGRRYASRALKARRFHITRVDRSVSGGVVEGVNDKEGITARFAVACGTDGVTVETSAGGRSWVEQGLRFGFYQVVDFGDRIFPPPTGPVVKLELLRGPEAKLEFPQELEPLGAVAVHVRLLNAGDRMLRIEPSRTRAVTASGAQALPYPAAEMQKRLGAVDPDAAAKILRVVKVKPGEKISGFVFFPVADYQSATLYLIDDKTGEADEYNVSFSESS